MKFGENLQKLRKEKGISQEQLAEQLGVTRQSVSKWESGGSYPEMDKLVTICQIFGCDLDSLINKDIAQEKSKQEATGIVKTVITETTTYIRKTIQLLEHKELKDIIKIIAQVLIIILVICLFRIPFTLIEDTISNIFYASDNIVSNFFVRFWHFIFAAGYGILAIAAFLYIFKIKFLDEEKLEPSSLKEEQLANEPEERQEPVKEVAAKEKVKQPNSSKNFSLLDLLVKIITIFLKGCFLLFLLPVIFGTVSTIIGLVLGIILIFKGLFLGGPLLFLIALIIFGIVIIELILNFVFNLKFSKRRIIITIITSIILGAIGFALSIWYAINLNIINEVPKTYKLTEKEQRYQMTENLLIRDPYGQTTYIEDNTIGSEVRVKISYYKDFNNVDLETSENRVNIIHKQHPNINSKAIVDDFIDNLKNNKIHTYNELENINMTITASKVNIEKLQENNASRYKTNNDIVYADENLYHDEYSN